jgi:hypothetical protein
MIWSHVANDFDRMLQVIVYLLAQKALFPRKVFLLRGNHETRIQNSYAGELCAFVRMIFMSRFELFGSVSNQGVWFHIN